MLRYSLIVLIQLIIVGFTSGKARLDAVYPSGWWVDMSYNNLLVIAYGENISNTNLTVDYPGIKINKITSTQSTSYLFIDMEISPQTPPGVVKMIFREGGKIISEYNFVLRLKNKDDKRNMGIKSADVLYQIVPDRFANGNSSNDNPKGYYERADRLNPAGVHGGDLQGISTNLDYIEDLGVTGIELTPVFESNQFSLSYDHYAITNFYKIDERLGSLGDYLKLIEDCHKRNMKVIQTFVFHQAGKQSEIIRDAPIENWVIPDTKKYLEEAYVNVFSDPYASKSDYNFNKYSWKSFDMPRLNQKDPHLKKYLIQNCLWWVETSGVDGIRIDYTSYNDKDFLHELTDILHKEFPGLSIVSDVETNYPCQVEYWEQKNIHPQHFSAFFTNSADYPLTKEIGAAFSTYDKPTHGLMYLYDILTRDFVYEDPANNLAFVDNHHLDRAYNVSDKELSQLKMMLAYILTIKRTPTILYGTEVLQEGLARMGDGFVRCDFPGGWPGDNVNAFTQKGLSSDQREMYDYLRKLLKWRKNSEAIHSGALTHYRPSKGMYVYFRTTELKTVMVIFNNDPDEQKRVDFKKYKENMLNFKFARDVMTGDIYSDFSGIMVYPKSVMILELEKTGFEE
ncbi:MAG: hypothetical protein GXO47_06850 [Chlorobi bacterium]|nr:hypothetical protein [Chlorobiota bacterium]